MPTGQTKTLTTDIDNVTGTSGADTFNALANTVLATGDIIEGGAGTDTLSSRHTITTALTIAPTTSSVEVHKVRLDHDGGAADVVTYDMTDISGATKVIMDRSTNSGSTADAVFTISGAGLTTGVTVGIHGGDTGADNSSVDFTATFQSVTGSSDSATLELDGAAANVVTIDNIETLNIVTAKNVTTASSTGASALNSLAASSAKTVNISGNGALTLTATNFDSTVSVNAANASGTIDYTAESSIALTYTGGSGNDRVNIGALSGLTASDQLTGGAGTDTLAVSDTGSGAVSTAEQALLATEVSGFERLEFTGTASVEVNMTDLAVFDTILFSGATTATAGTGQASAAQAGDAGDNAHTISGLDTGDAIIITAAIAGGAGEVAVGSTTTVADGGDGGDALVLSPLLDNGSNSVTITISANLTGGAGGNITAQGASAASGGDGGEAIAASSFESVTIITAQNSAGSLTSLSIAGGAAGNDGSGGTGADGVAGNSVVVATNGKIVVQGDVALDLGTISGTNATVDASAFTKALTVTGEDGANQITGGAGNDVLTGGLGTDTYTLGGGDNRVIIGLGANTTASDASAASSGSTPASVFETITDFDKASDVLEFLTSSDAALTENVITYATASAGTAALNIEGIASFNSADDTLSERVTAVASAVNAATSSATAGDLAVFEFAGSTYVFVSDATDGVSAGDIVVKLAGVTGITSTTINDSGYLVLG